MNVIVTSRHDENFRNRSLVEVAGLQPDEAVDLAKHLAKQPPVPAIRDANQVLQRALDILGHSPVLIELLVQRLRQSPDLGIMACVQSIAEAGERDLLKFFYDPAWESLSPRHQNVLLCLEHLGACSFEFLGPFCFACNTTQGDFRDKVLRQTWAKTLSYGDGSEDIALEERARKYLSFRLQDATAEERSAIHDTVREILSRFDDTFGLLPTTTAVTRRAMVAIQNRDYDEALRLADEALELEVKDKSAVAVFLGCKLLYHAPQHFTSTRWKEQLEKTSQGRLLLARSYAASVTGRRRTVADLEEGEFWLGQAKTMGADLGDVSISEFELLVSFLENPPSFGRRTPEEVDASLADWNRRAQRLASELDRRATQDQWRVFEDLVGRLEIVSRRAAE